MVLSSLMTHATSPVMSPSKGHHLNFSTPSFSSHHHITLVQLPLHDAGGCFYWFAFRGECMFTPPSQQCYRPTTRSNLIVLNGFPEIMGAREVGHCEREEKGGDETVCSWQLLASLSESRGAGQGAPTLAGVAVKLQVQRGCKV